MKTRWITLTGRLGGVLLIIGLVFVLAVFTPTTFRSTSGGSHRNLDPKKYSVGPQKLFCTPQTGFRFSGTSNGSFQFIIVAMAPGLLAQAILSWMIENDPNTNETYLAPGMDNVSVFVAFFRSNQNDVLLNRTLNSSWEFDFFPSRVTLNSIVYSNPSSDWVKLVIDFIGISTFASINILRPAVVLLVTGIVFISIWVIYSFQKRKKMLFPSNR